MSESSSRSLMQSTGVYLLAQGAQAAAGLLLIPIWTRSLTPSDYAITGTVGAHTTLLQVIFQLGLHGAAGKHYIDLSDNPPAQKRYLRSVMWFQILGPGALFVAINLLGPLLWSLTTNQTIPFDPYVRVAVSTALLTAWLTTPMVILQHQHRAGAYSAVQLGSFLINTSACFILVVMLKKGALGVLLSQCLAALATAAILLIWLFKYCGPGAIDRQDIRRALAYGLPLVPHLVASVVMFLADRIILEFWVKPDELGLYNFGAMLGGIMNILTSAINLAWAPRYLSLMKTQADPHPIVVKNVTIMLSGLAVLTLGGAIFADELVRLCFPPAYYGSVPYIGPILLAFLFQGCYFFAVNPLFYFDQTRRIALLSTIAAAFNVLCNIILVPRFGGLAAAWIAVLTHVLLFALVFRRSQQLSRDPYPMLRLGSLLLLVSATIYASGIIKLDGWLKGLLILIAILLAAHLARKPLNDPGKSA